MIPKRNKKGVIGIMLFFLALLTILILGFIAAMVWAATDFVSDEVTPIMEDLGVVAGANLSQASENTFGVLDDVIQAFNWVIAMSYVLALVFTLVFILVVGYSPHPAFIAIYFVLMILLIFGCVVMSNMYQDIYTSEDEISSRLQEQTILSYMILYSPIIMVIFAAVGGILMFARRSSAEGSSGGGFGV